MLLRPYLALALLISALVLPASAQGVENLGLAATISTHERAFGDFVAFRVSEVSQNVDLDGDGVVDDNVLHVRRVSTGTTVNTSIRIVGNNPGQPVVLGARWLLSVGFEFNVAPNGIDVNGDGDMQDGLHTLYDCESGTITHLPLAWYQNVVPQVALAGQTLLFGVAEAFQLADLNGDGDQLDAVLHSWNAGAPAAINLGLTLTNGSKIHAGLHHAMFFVSELDHGFDLNADGDTADDILHTINVTSSVVTNLGMPAHDVTGDGDLFAFAVHEDELGPTDLDADGDTLDSVIFIYVAPLGLVRNLARPGRGPIVRRYVVAWTSPEDELGGGTNWNGDGDTFDDVVLTHNARTGITRSTGLATQGDYAAEFVAILPRDRIATAVIEGAQGFTDLNGDGDVADRVVMIFDPSTGAVVNLLLPLAGSGLQASREALAFTVLEAAAGGDLNGDARLGKVVAVHHLATSTTVVLQPSPATEVDLRLAGPNVVFLADEKPFLTIPGTDLNGDGDRWDDVLFSWNALTATLTNHGIAVHHGNQTHWPSSHFPCARTSALMNVSEMEQGNTDLNNDGDLLDFVAHVARF